MKIPSTLFVLLAPLEIGGIGLERRLERGLLTPCAEVSWC